jgi:signal transduction histidine kinase
MAADRTPTDEGRVVYRRVAPPDDSPRPRRERRFDPALLPLVIGFAILLLLVLAQGNLSVRRLEDISRGSLQLEQSYAARASLLLQFRVALTRLDNEARNRAESDARRELRPPFDLRLDTARGKVSELLPWLDHPPISDLPKWQKFRTDLSTYLDNVRERERYARDGYVSFRAVDNDLNDLIAETGAEEHQIASQAEGLQAAAARSIRLWNIIALVMGFAIAVLTLWEVQRRFRQTKQSTEAARREREFSNQMLEGMVSAIAAIDRRDHIRSANAAFFRIFPQATIGSSIHDDIASPEGVKLLEAATASHVVAATYRGRWPFEQDDGTVTFDVYSSPLEIDGEHGQILTLVDVTEATKSEILLRRTESLAAVGSAAAQLAHEIKNPLGSIRLGVEMLRQYTTAPEAEKTISLVERGIHHLNKLVVDVTQFSRHRQLDLSDVDLRNVINSSVELVMDRVHEKETPLTVDFDEESIHGNWDESQLREVFVNLLANAIDASTAKSPVNVSTELVDREGRPATVGEVARRDTRARIVIVDEGAGMDQKTLARLFEPFFTTKKRGTGLGLSIVRQIIDLHGGTIDVQSTVGKGTTFKIELPLDPSGQESRPVGIATGSNGDEV